MQQPRPGPSAARAIVLVRSPHAGNYRRLRRPLGRALRRAGVRVVAELDLADRHHVRGWLSLPPAERPVVVAAGGDGTVGAVAELLAGTDGVLGILPLGTNNNVARSLGIPSRVEDAVRDRKSTRLNSSHANISYAVFCLKKKTQQQTHQLQ